MKNMGTALAVTTTPLMMDVWGVNIPALSMVMGLVTVVLVRIMLMAKDYRNEKSFWYFNVSLTILLAFITFAVIADRQLGPGMSVMVGTGIGASGMVIVDLMKDRVQQIFKAAIGEKNNDKS